MNYKNHVEDLKNKCDVFLRQVENIGNECAWTDRAVENVLASAQALHKAYHGKEDLSHGTVSIDDKIRAAEVVKNPDAVFAGNREHGIIERD